MALAGANNVAEDSANDLDPNRTPDQEGRYRAAVPTPIGLSAAVLGERRPVTRIPRPHHGIHGKVAQASKVSLSALKSQLAARVATALSCVTSRYIYIDTVQFLTKVRPDMHPNLYQRRRFRIEPTGKLPWAWSIRCQQPSIGDMENLERLCPVHLVTRFDLALDLIMPDQEAAYELQKFLRNHLTQPWRGQRRLNRYKETDYFGKASSGRNIAIYSDKPSKITGGPVTHVEFRFNRAAVCGARGVTRLSDLISLDPCPIIERCSKLSVLSWIKADKEIEAMARYSRSTRGTKKKRKPMSELRAETDRRLAHALRDGNQPIHPLEAPVQDVIDTSRAYDLGLHHAVISISARMLLSHVDALPPLIKVEKQDMVSLNA